MKEEIFALQKNNTWELTYLPEGEQFIDNKWVYKVKNSIDDKGNVYRARLVARGFTQRYGVDYEETFSPVAKFGSIRLLLSVAVRESLKLVQFDVKTAFLYGDLENEIYMKQPDGFDDNTGRVCKLKKSLYGLKQASRCWNKKFTKFLNTFELKATAADPCIFTGKNMIIASYIDDGLIAAKNDRDISELIKYLKEKFEIKIAKAKMFLGLEIERLEDGTLYILQRGYIQKILSKFNMLEANSVSTPSELTLCRDLSDTEQQHDNTYPFREAVGSLMYLAICTRPDIAHVVGVVSRYLDKPREQHIKAVKRVFRYLKGTINYGIYFSNKSDFVLHCYSDADYAGDPDTRRSTSGYILMLGDSPIVWSSQRQKCVSLSTTEAEYISATAAATEIVWIKRLLDELVNIKYDSILFVDNQSAIKLVKNPEFHKRSKHIDIRYHYIREKYAEGIFKIQYLTSENQRADILTKPLGEERFQKLRNIMGVKELN